MFYENLSKEILDREGSLTVGTDWEYFLYGGRGRYFNEVIKGQEGAWIPCKEAYDKPGTNISSAVGAGDLWWYRRPAMAPTDGPANPRMTR